MCDSRKRKYRHENTIESSKTVKAIFKKDDLDDSLSTSDWGLIQDDSAKTKRRGSRLIKLIEEPLTLICAWNMCGEQFTEYSAFNLHVMDHLNGHLIDDGESIRCYWLDCTYEASCMNALSQHLCFHGYHTKLKVIGRNVTFRENLPECIQSEKFVIPIEPNGYECEWENCFDKFNTIHEFFEHVRIHVYHCYKGWKEGPILCCWKGCSLETTFKSQYKLQEHLRIHTKERLLACPTCGILFANRTKFCDHRKRQLPENRQSYLCSQCTKYFPSERLLRDHMRQHINHYKCSMCEMTCTKPSILAKHIRYRHMKEKPYKCNLCTYSCVSKHNLDLHMKTHNPEGLFKCSDCNFECRSAFGLDQHYQRRHGKGWTNVYECHNCKKRFNRGGLLTKHLMKVHNYHWPSGHSRFRYKEEQDGIYRLQTVRYETIDVTQEIIKGSTMPAPSKAPPLKFVMLKKEAPNPNSVDNFEICVSNETESQKDVGKKVVITIDDLDSKGNVLKSQTIQASEIICDSLEEIVPISVTNDLTEIDAGKETANIEVQNQFIMQLLSQSDLAFQVYRVWESFYARKGEKYNMNILNVRESVRWSELDRLLESGGAKS